MSQPEAIQNLMVNFDVVKWRFCEDQSVEGNIRAEELAKKGAGIPLVITID